MEFNKDYILATTHEFKSNISRLTRYLESGGYAAVFVTRHGRVVGAFATGGAEGIYEQMRKRARNEGRLPVSSYEDDIFRDR